MAEVNQKYFKTSGNLGLKMIDFKKIVWKVMSENTLREWTNETKRRKVKEGY